MSGIIRPTFDPSPSAEPCFIETLKKLSDGAIQETTGRTREQLGSCNDYESHSVFDPDSGEMTVPGSGLDKPTVIDRYQAGDASIPVCPAHFRDVESIFHPGSIYSSPNSPSERRKAIRGEANLDRGEGASWASTLLKKIRASEALHSKWVNRR